MVKFTESSLTRSVCLNLTIRAEWCHFSEGRRSGNTAAAACTTACPAPQYIKCHTCIPISCMLKNDSKRLFASTHESACSRTKYHSVRLMPHAMMFWPGRLPGTSSRSVARRPCIRLFSATGVATEKSSECRTQSWRHLLNASTLEREPGHSLFLRWNNRPLLPLLKNSDAWPHFSTKTERNRKRSRAKNFEQQQSKNSKRKCNCSWGSSSSPLCSRHHRRQTVLTSLFFMSGK